MGTFPPINVKDAPYNAAGDGTTDDTMAIQDAIDDAHVVIGGATYGRELIVPHGIYLCSTLTFSNVGGNTSTLLFRGAGVEATTFKLKAGTNGPLFDVGGTSSPSLVVAAFRDFSLHGNKANQSSAAPLMRIRNVDRSLFEHIYVGDSKGDAWSISNSSVLLRDCQGFLSDGHGCNVVDSCSVVIERGYYNNNALHGIRANYTGGGGILNGQEEFGLKIHDVHLEQNTDGEVWLDTVDNVTMTDCEVNASATGSVPTDGVVLITGPSRNCRIIGNTIANRNLYSQHDDGDAFTVFNWLVLESQTVDCVYDVPRYVATSEIGGSTVAALSNAQIVDTGHNRPVSATSPGPEGHLRAKHQNLLLYSEDFTQSGTWVPTNLDSVTLVAPSWGHPFDAAGTPAQIVATSGQIGNVQQNVTIAAATAGDKYTASVWLYSPATNDVRLEIRGGSDALLARTFARLDPNWRRYSVPLVCGGGETSLRFRLVRYGGAPSQAFYAWGAQLQQGAAGDYIPTGAAAVVGSAGIIAYGSTTWNPANCASGSTQNTTVTVPGARAGDIATVAFTTALPNGTLLNANVTANDQVTVCFANLSGSSVDLASGTVYVMVLRRV